MAITIIYPKEDYEAANVAVKVQALAQSRNQRIYVVPKHYGKNKTEIQKNLEKTTVALFISQSSGNIDSSTLEELKFLKTQRKEIIGFLPDGVVIPKNLEKYISLQRYHSGDANSLRNTILKYLTQVKPDKENQNALLVVIGLLLFLLLLAFNSDD